MQRPFGIHMFRILIAISGLNNFLFGKKKQKIDQRASFRNSWSDENGIKIRVTHVERCRGHAL